MLIDISIASLVLSSVFSSVLCPSSVLFLLCFCPRLLLQVSLLSQAPPLLRL
jgi:hypothetical protein